MEHKSTKHKRERWFTPVMSATRLSSLCQHLTSTRFCSTVAMCLAARVVAISLRPTTASKDSRSYCVASLGTGRAFETSPCGARTTIKEIVLNLNLMGKEEGKRTVLASSRKRAEILYHLNWKFIGLLC